MKDTMQDVKWRAIQAPADFNMRRELPEVKRLAADIALRGLLHPIVIRNGGPDETPWVIVSGNRRFAAYALNGWEERTIACTVREYKKGDTLGPLMDNIAENIEREDVDYFDLAERVHQFLTGTYPVGEGSTAEPVDQKQIATLINRDLRTVQKLARVFRDVDPEVVAKARKHGIPSWLWIAISQLDGDKELEKEARLVVRAKLQMARLDEYIAKKEELAATGRERAPSEPKKKKKSSSTKSPTKVGPNQEEDWHAIVHDVIIDEKKDRCATDYYELLKKKTSYEKDAKLSKDERERATLTAGAFAMMRVLSGELEKLPFVTEADWTEFCPPPADDEEDENVREEA